MHVATRFIGQETWIRGGSRILGKGGSDKYIHNWVRGDSKGLRGSGRG